MHIPGLKLILPSTCYDAKGLLISAIADPNPVLIIDHRFNFKQKGMVPEEMYRVPIGKGIIRRKGKDVTVVALSHLVLEAFQAAEELAAEGIDCELIDPRTLRPLDEEIILTSVAKTGRLVVTDTGWKTGGVTAEIGALVAEKGFSIPARARTAGGQPRPTHSRRIHAGGCLLHREKGYRARRSRSGPPGMKGFMDRNSRIFVAGGETLIGSSILQALKRQGYGNVFQAKPGPDLLHQGEVEAFFHSQAPEYVFLAAGKSGGIAANQKFPAEFMLDNLLIECHVIDAAYCYGAKKLLYLASSCCYPRECPQPMRGKPAPHRPAGADERTLCRGQDRRVEAGTVLSPPVRHEFYLRNSGQLFRPGRRLRPEDSHVISALMRRMHEAKQKGMKEVTVWGTGKPRREFIYTDDLADACIFIMKRYEGIEPINLGSGEGPFHRRPGENGSGGDPVFRGNPFRFLQARRDAPKLLDTTKLKAMGWKGTVSFLDGLRSTYSGIFPSYGFRSKTVRQEPVRIPFLSESGFPGAPEKKSKEGVV